MKDNTEDRLVFFIVMMIVLNQFFPLAAIHFHAGHAQHNVMKDDTEDQLVFFTVVIVLNLFFPLALSRLTINTPPTEEGKQTSQESLSTSKRPRSNQELVRNVNCIGGSQAPGYPK